jgi:hypothetical protein
MRRDVQCGSKILPVAFVSVSLALRILLGILLPSFAFHKRIQCHKEKNSTFTYTHTIVDAVETWSSVLAIHLRGAYN